MLVLTEQKRHPRVQVSPISIIVAVAVDGRQQPSDEGQDRTT